MKNSKTKSVFLIYGEQTETISFKVPASKKDEIIAEIRDVVLSKYEDPKRIDVDVKKKSDPTDNVISVARKNEVSPIDESVVTLDEVYDCVVVTKGVPDVAYRKNISYKSDLAFLDVHDSDVYYGFVNGVYYKFVDKKEFDRFCGDYLIK